MMMHCKRTICRAFNENTHSDVVILARRRESIRLRGEVLLVRGASFLGRNRLKVARIDRLAIMPADFERSYAHRGQRERAETWWFWKSCRRAFLAAK